MRFDIRRIGTIKQGEEAIGSRTRVKVVKNKLASPFRECEFDVLYGEGINKLGELVDIGSDLNIVEKSGAWYSFAGQRIGQGRDNARLFLRDNPEAAVKIEAEIRARSAQAAQAAQAASNPQLASTAVTASALVSTMPSSTTPSASTAASKDAKPEAKGDSKDIDRRAIARAQKAGEA